MVSVSLLPLLLIVGALMVHAHLPDHRPDPSLKAHHKRILSESCHANKNMLLEDDDTTCLLDPEASPGPYWWPTVAIRKDIKEDREGFPLTLRLRVVNSSTCEPVHHAAVEVWHATWDGIYSHFEEVSRDRALPSTDRQNPTATDNSTYLRGIQYTDEDGWVEFTTVFPGWYEGRCLHIHTRVMFDIVPNDDNTGYTGGTSAHVGQLYMPEEVFDAYSVLEPYNGNDNGIIPRDTDVIWFLQNGPYGVLNMTKNNPAGDWDEGGVAVGQMGILTKETVGWHPEMVPDYTEAPEPTEEPTEEPEPVCGPECEAYKDGFAEGYARGFRAARGGRGRRD